MSWEAWLLFTLACLVWLGIVALRGPSAACSPLIVAGVGTAAIRRD